MKVLQKMDIHVLGGVVDVDVPDVGAGGGAPVTVDALVGEVCDALVGVACVCG